MCYRCNLCGGVVPPKVSMRTIIISRVVPARKVSYLRDTDHGQKMIPADEPTRTEIEREIPVCMDCHNLVLGGLTVGQVKKLRGPRSEARPVRLPRPPRAPDGLTGKIVSHQ